MTGLVAYILSKKYTTKAISELGSVLRFKGVVDTFNDLPTTGNKQGDVYEVREKKAEYVWIWDNEQALQGHWELFGEVKSTNKSFPSEWETNNTRAYFCQQVVDDLTALVGDCYFGGIAFKPQESEMPSGILNGESVVSIFQSTLGYKVIHVDLYSATTAPYTWSFNYYNDGTTAHITPWIPALTDVTVDGDSVVVNGVASITLTGKQDKLTAGQNILISDDNVISAVAATYTAGNNIQISDEGVISATDTTYTAGNNIEISTDNVISANVRTYRPLKAEWKLAAVTGQLTLAEFCGHINADTSVAEGDAYCGNITSTKFFNGMYFENASDPLTSAEVSVQIMGPWGTGHVMLLSVTSSNHAPYYWQYTWVDGLASWVSWTDVRYLATSTTTKELKYLSINGTQYKLPVTEIVDNLTTDDSTKALSAKQGKELKTLIDNVKTYQGFPSDFVDGSKGETLAQFIQSVLQSSGKQQGKAYLGELYAKCTPDPSIFSNVEAKVEYMLDGVAVVTVYSSNISPYHWELNTAQGTWRKWSDVKANPSESATQSLTKLTVDGTTYSIDSAGKETDITLSEDLYTYAPIGVLSLEGGKPISATNPKLVASEGESLKKVFNTILGTATDTNPTINQGGTTFTKSGQTGTTSVSGAEIGQAISAQDGTVTYKVTNTATCSYGLKTSDADTYNKKSATTFNYPVKSRSVTIGDTTYNYQIKIKYPALNSCTVSVTTGTLVVNDTTNRYLYCNLHTDNTVVVKISMPATTSTASQFTRFDQLEADVEFNNAQYDGKDVINFWTYLKNSYTASGMSHSAITGVKSTAYVVTAGTRYAYSKVTSSTTVPASNLTKQAAESTFHTSGADFSYSLGDYLYFYRTVSGLTVETYVLGQWASATFTALPVVEVTQANGAKCNYYPYRVGPMEATGSAKYRV